MAVTSEITTGPAHFANSVEHTLTKYRSQSKTCSDRSERCAGAVALTFSILVVNFLLDKFALSTVVTLVVCHVSHLSRDIPWPISENFFTLSGCDGTNRSDLPVLFLRTRSNPLKVVQNITGSLQSFGFTFKARTLFLLYRWTSWIVNRPTFCVRYTLLCERRRLFSESELTFTFAICCRLSVWCRLSVVCLPVTLVHPTQAVEIFGSIYTALGTVAIQWHPLKISRTSFQGNPSTGGLNKRG